MIVNKVLIINFLIIFTKYLLYIFAKSSLCNKKMYLPLQPYFLKYI